MPSLQQRGKTSHWLERYHFVASTLVLGMKISFVQPLRWMEFQKLAETKWLPVMLYKREHAKHGVTYTRKSASSDCLYVCQILGNKRTTSHTMGQNFYKLTNIFNDVIVMLIL